MYSQNHCCTWMLLVCTSTSAESNSSASIAARLDVTAAGQPQPHQCWLHWMDLMSMPSCTISHSGLISRSFSTCATVSATARSTSSAVVKRPRPNLHSSAGADSKRGMGQWPNQKGGPIEAGESASARQQELRGRPWLSRCCDHSKISRQMPCTAMSSSRLQARLQTGCQCMRVHSK